MISFRRRLIGSAIALAIFSTNALAQQAISNAEKHVFMTDHLKNVAPATTLHYQFTKSGSLEAAFEDKVTIAVTAPATGPGKNCQVDFLSGKNQFRGMPETIENATGNPVILAFLERDLGEMKRITKGQPNYYRKRIRMSFAQKAEAKSIKVKVSGKDIAAKQIVLTPFEDDPARSRYEKFSNKSYTITLSDEVPGGVYKIHSRMVDRASKDAATAPMIEETLIFTGSKK
jgi:hypothetical protein